MISSPGSEEAFSAVSSRIYLVNMDQVADVKEDFYPEKWKYEFYPGAWKKELIDAYSNCFSQSEREILPKISKAKRLCLNPLLCQKLCRS